MRAFAIVLVLSLTACSFFQIPRVDQNVPAPCSRSKQPVTVDLVAGTLTIVAGLAVILFVEPDDYGEERNIPATVAGGAISLTGIGFLAAAKIGSDRADECRQMQSVDPRYGASDE